jgi:hypothetical protein
MSFGIELRRGQFDISVDGNSVGSISYQETVEAQLDAGSHTIVVRKGRYSSRPHTFDAVDGQVVRFNCHGTRLWMLYLASFVVPTLAIALKPE